MATKMKVVFKQIIKEQREYIFETKTGKRKNYWLKKGDIVFIYVKSKFTGKGR